METDQKPLVSICKKHMVDISPSVQRLIVRSFPYQPFTVIYKKGRDIPVADALSRVTPMSSIYHRHIEHFFTFLAGNTVFSLVSESPH